VSKLGPLNDLFESETATITSPTGEVVPVKTYRFSKPDPKKELAWKALENAREALRVAEENYRTVSKDDQTSRIKLLDDFYRDKWVLEYDRLPMMMGKGVPIKENFIITKVEKVIFIGNGFVSVKGKMLKVAGKDKLEIPYGGSKLSVSVATGNDLRISRVDQVLTGNQLDKLLDKVRNNFFDKTGSIW